MTPEQFCYWLQGFSETMPDSAVPLQWQWRMVQEHLNLVIKKETLLSTPIFYKPDQNKVVPGDYPPGTPIMPGDYPPGTIVTC